MVYVGTGTGRSWKFESRKVSSTFFWHLFSVEENGLVARRGRTRSAAKNKESPALFSPSCLQHLNDLSTQFRSLSDTERFCCVRPVWRRCCCRAVQRSNMADPGVFRKPFEEIVPPTLPHSSWTIVERSRQATNEHPLPPPAPSLPFLSFSLLLPA